MSYCFWNTRNTRGSTPLYIAEGYRDGALRRSPPTIDAIVKLMESAGVSTAGERPRMINIYARPAAPPASPQPR